VLSSEERAEDVAVVARERIEDPHGATGAVAALRRKAVEEAHRRRGIGHLGEGIEVAQVAVERDVAIAEEPGDALTGGHPQDDALSVAVHAPPGAKLLRLVDDGLDAEN
jgi:hypothetical protein